MVYRFYSKRKHFLVVIGLLETVHSITSYFINTTAKQYPVQI